MLARDRTIKVRSSCEIDSFIKACNHNKHRSSGELIQEPRFARLDKHSGSLRDTCARINNNASNPAKNDQKQTVFVCTISVVDGKNVSYEHALTVEHKREPEYASICHSGLKLLDLTFIIHHFTP
jgi:hypothetical protein